MYIRELISVKRRDENKAIYISTTLAPGRPTCHAKGSVGTTKSTRGPSSAALDTNSSSSSLSASPSAPAGAPLAAAAAAAPAPLDLIDSWPLSTFLHEGWGKVRRFSTVVRNKYGNCKRLNIQVITGSTL